MSNLNHPAYIPSEKDTKISMESRRILSTYLTTQKAADLLNVSRPFLIKQIDQGEIPHHKVGKHLRINFNDLMVYKERVDQEASAALGEIVAISEELGLYD
jgi:excisionase family DNA binding protein